MAGLVCRHECLGSRVVIFFGVSFPLVGTFPMKPFEMRYSQARCVVFRIDQSVDPRGRSQLADVAGNDPDVRPLGPGICLVVQYESKFSKSVQDPASQLGRQRSQKALGTDVWYLSVHAKLVWNDADSRIQS